MMCGFVGFVCFVFCWRCICDVFGGVFCTILVVVWVYKYGLLK
jgi:hypothetical protein